MAGRRYWANALSLPENSIKQSDWKSILMASKAFTLQRICIYAGMEFDPNSDAQVKEVLQDNFNIFLPQRQSMNEALEAVVSDHEIIELIKKYRLMR
ncbi:MAG: DNA polymerase [Motiliproteus sp.]|nr:DNA polymerase [Motiliproteus sp.]MCW9054301.1 DNA polymerase [Motiliproteus sp.]